MAIEQGLNILSWHENLPDEERPPEHLWEDGQGLEQWWATVQARRNEDGAHISRGREDHDPDDQTPVQTENDHARFLKQAYA